MSKPFIHNSIRKLKIQGYAIHPTPKGLGFSHEVVIIKLSRALDLNIPEMLSVENVGGSAKLTQSKN